jgi:two-component system nitrate/nitrite response regulator NarL
MDKRAAAPSRRSVGVLTVDDHPLFRQGIRHMLQAEEGVEPMGEVGSVEEALAWLATSRADVVLLDHDLPGLDGVESLPKLLEAQSDLQVIVLTVCDDDDVFLQAIRLGACAYMLKDAPPERLIEAILAAANGECRVSGRMVRTLFDRVSRRDIDDPVPGRSSADDARSPREEEKVTARERDVLGYLAKGLANKEIAKELGLSPNTVRNQLQRLQERFHARNRVQLALFARDRGYD